MVRSTYDPDSLLVGVIGRPHGLRGELTLRPYNSRGADLAGVPRLILERESGREEHTVQGLRRAKDGWLVCLQGIDSREAAGSLTHAEVRVRKSWLPPLGPSEFFVEDLIGCQVRTESGQILGVVDGVFWNGAQDVISVVVPDDAGQEQEQLIPLVPDFIRSVDAPARQMVVAWEE